MTLYYIEAALVNHKDGSVETATVTTSRRLVTSKAAIKAARLWIRGKRGSSPVLSEVVVNRSRPMVGRRPAITEPVFKAHETEDGEIKETFFRRGKPVVVDPPDDSVAGLGKVAGTHLVVRNNAVEQALEYARRIHESAKAIKMAQSPAELIERLVDMQFRCADTIQRLGGKIGHVLLVAEKHK